MNDFTFFAQQGWQCPICKRVYSPSTPMCYYCGGDNRTSVDTTTNPNSTGIDYKKYDSTTTTDTKLNDANTTYKLRG